MFCLTIFRSLLRRTFTNSSASISSFTWRTHTCGELGVNHVDREVTICGWSTYRRCDKFIILRDTYGQVQVIFKENDSSTKKFIQSLPFESVIQVKGIIRRRPPKDVNKKMPTGEVEVEASDVKLLNSSIPNLPINTKGYDKVGDITKLKYRYLGLRIPKLQENLRLRSKVLMKMREFLHDKHGFVDIETPTLFKRTPGGAKEFIVPTKFPGQFYSLVQSPQQFKQMLMVGSLDRYFQIARCYRNEGTKPDRQPEFTQVDIELSFTTSEDIQRLVENLMRYSWPVKKREIKTPFLRMTYNEAMRSYGTDKPDLRYEMKLQDLTEEFKGESLNFMRDAECTPHFRVYSVVVPNGSKYIKNPFIKELQQQNEQKLLPIFIKSDLTWNSPIAKHIQDMTQENVNQKLLMKPNDLVLICAGRYEHVCKALGKVRTECAKHLHSQGVDVLKAEDMRFVWITDFPLFLAEETGKIESGHHPFTAPHPDDIDLVYTSPLEARSQHFDLVLNGQEIAGGSIRIHDAQLQKYVLEEVLKENTRDLQHLLDALSSGCPPHGGIALGVDRLLAIICNCHSIVDVIAFPKSSDGKDLMSGAPAPLSEEDKLLYHIEAKLPSS